VIIPDLFIADWSNIVHRAFHGLGAGSDLHALDVVSMARSICLEVATNHCFVNTRIAFVLDGGLSGRREIYPEYKDNRTQTTDRPMALIVSADGSLLKDTMFDWRGTPVKVDGYEADDIMIGLAREQEKAGGQAYIFTNDSDILQCVNGSITVLRPRKYPDPPEIFGAEEVEGKYGFRPPLMIHWKALQGDKADNIPRIPKIGEGTASKLVATYGGVHNVIRAALREEMTPMVNKNIIEYRESILLNLRLVTAVPVPNIEAVYEGVMKNPPSIV
jgi:DNA polymerase I